MGYETDIKGVKDSLKTKIDGTTSFSGVTHFDYWKPQVSDTLIALCRIERDRITALGPKETQHILTFSAWVRFKGTGTEANLDSIIGYVGEIVDTIEADRKINNSIVNNTEVVLVEYTTEKYGESTLFYHARMTIEVRVIRNV